MSLLRKSALTERQKLLLRRRNGVIYDRWTAPTLLLASLILSLIGAVEASRMAEWPAYLAVLPYLAVAGACVWWTRSAYSARSRRVLEEYRADRRRRGARFWRS